MNAFIHETDSVYWNRGVTGDKNLTYACFSKGRSIFVTGILSDTDIFRAMEDDFGILPYPKYNEQQKNYHSTSRDNLSVFAVPVDAKNPGMTGLITEAMCIASYEEVVPVYYEVVLKDKMSRDENSKDMIDLIRDSLVFNFGYLHSTAMGSVGHLFLNRIIANSNTIVSEFDAKASTYNEKLKTVLEIYR